MAVPPFSRTVHWGMDWGVGAALAVPRLGLHLALRVLDTSAALGDVARLAAIGLRSVLGEEAAPGPFSDDDFASEWEAEAPAASPAPAPPAPAPATAASPPPPGASPPPPPAGPVGASVQTGADVPSGGVPSGGDRDDVRDEEPFRPAVPVLGQVRDREPEGDLFPVIQLADPVAPADEVAEGELIDSAELPLADYDHLTLGSLRGRLRRLAPRELETLRDYERAHANRLQVVTMLENRLRKLAEDSSAAGDGADSAR